MPFSLRIQHYDTGIITAASTGSASYYTVHAIVGRILKVAVLTNASGAFTLTESGTGDIVLGGVAVASGTAYSIYYPRTKCNATGGAVLSYASGTEQSIVANYLQAQHTAGSAVSPGYSFQNVIIYYQ